MACLIRACHVNRHATSIDCGMPFSVKNRRLGFIAFSPTYRGHDHVCGQVDPCCVFISPDSLFAFLYKYKEISPPIISWNDGLKLIPLLRLARKVSISSVTPKQRVIASGFKEFASIFPSDAPTYMYAAAKESCINAIIKTMKFPLATPRIDNPCQAVMTLTKRRYALKDLTLSFIIFLHDFALVGSGMECRCARYITDWAVCLTVGYLGFPGFIPITVPLNGKPASWCHLHRWHA